MVEAHAVTTLYLGSVPPNGEPGERGGAQVVRTRHRLPLLTSVHHYRPRFQGMQHHQMTFRNPRLRRIDPVAPPLISPGRAGGLNDATFSALLIYYIIVDS